MARRIKCIKCKELTHSAWNLGYTEKGQWVQGIHCFKCKQLVAGRTIEDRPAGLQVTIK